MHFFLIDKQTEQQLMFPINPPEVQVTQETKVLSFSPLKLGEVEVPRGRQPIRLSWEGMLPGIMRPLPSRHSELNPNAIIHQLRTWMNAEKKLRLVITASPWNLPVFITSFDSTHGDAAGDVHYSITFTEWRDMLVQEKKAEADGNKNKETKRDTKDTPKTHTVVKGENLWNIARKYAGQGSKWPELWKINKDKSKSKNPDLIYPGEVFTLPSGW